MFVETSEKVQEKKLKAKLYNVFSRQNTRVSKYLRDQSCRQ